jgi:hypothetical protein
MPNEDQQKGSIPWPYWMLRFIASDNENSFWDLVWSVGGSPPYGGVSCEEAEAVYNLVEESRGPGIVSEERYGAMRGMVGANPYKLDVIEMFQCNNKITSNPSTFTEKNVADGIAVSDRLNDLGVRSLFLAYKAQLGHRNGNMTEARECALAALSGFLQLADQDATYGNRVAQLAQNAVSFTAMSGDMEGAKKLQLKLRRIMDDFGE